MMPDYHCTLREYGISIIFTLTFIRLGKLVAVKLKLACPQSMFGKSLVISAGFKLPSDVTVDVTLRCTIWT